MCLSTACAVSIDSSGAGVDPATWLGLAPGISLRREWFGGLAYCHRTRRLQVIQSKLALQVADRLKSGGTVREVVAWLNGGDDRGRAAAERQVLLAVERLIAVGVLVQVGRADETGPTDAE